MSEATESIVTKTGSRLIAVRISEADKARAGEEIAGHLQAIADAKDRKKSFDGKIKEETDRREKQIETLRQTLISGTEQRQIPCEYQYDYEHASVTIIRLDTDPPEVLDKRAMTTDEFRVTMDPEPEEPPVEEGESHEPEREPPPWDKGGVNIGEGPLAVPPEETTHEQGTLPDFGEGSTAGIPDSQYPEVDEEDIPPAPGGPEGDPDSSPLGPVSDPAAAAKPPGGQMPSKPKGGKKK